jgi:ATP-dependent Clp protease ATP-binding subunit ClpC
MFERFTDRARRVVVLAQEEARMLNHNYIGTEHILLGLLHEGESVAARALESLGISLEAVRQQVEEIIGQGQQAPPGHIPFTPRARSVLELSLREALQLGHNYIGPEHILLALIREGEGVAAQILVRLGTDVNRVRQQVIVLLHSSQQEQAGAGPPPLAPVTPDLPFRDLTADARQGSLAPVLGREREVGELVGILELGAPRHAFLVGDRGSGVSAVAAGLAEEIARPGASPSLGWMRVLEVDLSPLEHGGGDRVLGMVSGRLRELRETIVFVERACIPVRPGGWPAIALLRVALEECEVRVIAAATPAELQEARAAGDWLQDQFRAVEVPGLSPELTEQVLGGIRDRFEGQHRVEITDAAIAAAVMLAGEYLPGRPLPGRAISLLGRTAADVARRTFGVVADEDIADIRVRKEAAIDAQDFERATALRAEEKRMVKANDEAKAKAEAAVAGRNVPDYRVVAVTEADVAAVAASAGS